MSQLSGETNHLNFATRKWNIVNDLSNAYHPVGSEIIFSKEVLKSNLCDFNDA